MIRFFFVLGLTLAVGLRVEESTSDNYGWLHLLALAGGTSVLTFFLSWVLSRFILLWAFNKVRSALNRRPTTYIPPKD